MIRAGSTLLEALGAAVDTARETHVARTRTDVCPDCQGSGIRGRRFAEGTDTCGVCSGTGEVPADGVVHCSNPSCHAVCWADQVCTHTEDEALCPDCAPAHCRACIDERVDR